MIIKVALSAVIAIFSSMAFADTQTFTIIDKNGQPVSNAVVLVDKSLLTKVNVPQGNVVIDQIDKQFVPKVSSIEQGTTVVFPNSDNIRHHVYSFSAAKPFELKLYSDKERPKVTFDQSGIVTLGCNIHDGMIGYVVVNNDVQGFVTNQSGTVSIDIDNAASEQVETITLRVWHPWMSDNLGAAQTIELSTPIKAGDITLDVAPPEPEKKEKSRLEKRFNRLGA
ncbi:hypothetical protein DFP83_101245 [Idiomarina fontislapidosi]|uniref:Methylamine utilization protein n=1 Tax=Idiomarina fontislapidosi TaxID=263723 RepID=A0A432YB77_9GAMM|nr:methylamine utilization protein [Idiomarina fontislapidosi]PYE35358.1 hypothetical protein DFP83_101245 [Idiomarina fontislapidosi]RUO58245.1 methylamine utilization protein [Idiomarina fontislapidosi]|tara:strand:- start:1241 stop:1912 length:672 start_codon:yes stop_codon:yes gene_type:complete